MEETMMNNEVMELVEDNCVPTSKSNLGGKLVCGALVAGGIFAAIKLIKKFKAKKATQYADVQPKTSDDEEVIDAEIVEELNKKLN